jgi:hypothetical protein
MAKTRAKDEIITFKVDASLWNLMRGIENRSEFIRGAILTALGSVCPLCRGTGVLTPKQKEHWDAFAEAHPIRECDDCHEFHLVCAAEDEG